MGELNPDWVLRRAEGGILIFYCPGCERMHSVWTQGPVVWQWNGDMVRPTFSPSILISQEEGTPPVTPENLEQWRLKPWPQTQVTKRCHTFVKDGQIQFLGDCTHALAGKTVPLPKDPLSHLYKSDSQI
jgi:hypothetical protein